MEYTAGGDTSPAKMHYFTYQDKAVVLFSYFSLTLKLERIRDGSF